MIWLPQEKLFLNGGIKVVWIVEKFRDIGQLIEELYERVTRIEGILLEISVDDIVKILRAEGIIECCTARDVQ